MIAPLRARHRAMTTGLALVLPILFVLSLAARPQGEPAQARESAPEGAARIEGSLSASTWLNGDGGLVVLPDGDPRLPDVLLYWSPTPPVDEALPPGSRLIGALAGARRREFSAPEAEGGTLVAYSLGHGRVVGSGPKPAGGR